MFALLGIIHEATFFTISSCRRRARGSFAGDSCMHERSNDASPHPRKFQNDPPTAGGMRAAATGHMLQDVLIRNPEPPEA